MEYEVTYGIRPLWMGRTETTQYFLYRATIRPRAGSWELPGYALWASHGRWQELVEVCADIQIEPGNGLYRDMIAHATATTQQLPDADPKDIAEFATLFAELCEDNEDPLLESELLV